MNLKVAHVMRRFTPSKWGGTESVVFNICQQLQKRNIETVIFCTDMFAESGTEVISNVPVKRHSYVFPWLFLGEESTRKMQLKGGSPLSFSLFFSLLREPNLTLIHTHVQHRLGGIARSVARWRGIPYVVSIHGGYLTIPTEHAAKMQQPFKGKWEWGKLFGWLLGARRTLEDANAIICVGQDEFELMKTKFPNKRIHYLPNGVNQDRFSSADPHLFRRQYGFADNEKYILCVSRIDFQKNQVLLVKAFADFVQKHPEYKLVLIGPVNVEDYHKEILNTAKDLNIENRILTIPGYHPDDPLLPSAYRGADMFVLPSRTEPFGIVILEAWAAGVPVIASKVGGIPGFTHHEQDILLFEDNNQQELAITLERLATDDHLRRNLTQHALTEVEKYSWSAVAESLLSIYSSL
ncbi:MAG: glycosyltransferase family 4 protein [Chlamydiales bacterium]|nr:glycosyltransferase family 4 protein [Chlamydiales bacterium]